MRLLAKEGSVRWWHNHRTVPLSWYLVAIISVATVPLAGFAAYLVLQQSKAANTQLEQGLRSAASAVALTVERDVATSTEILQTLTEPDPGRPLDRAAIERELTRLLARRADWTGVFLLDAAGAVVVARGDQRALALVNSGALRTTRFGPNTAPGAFQLVRQRVGEDDLTALAIPFTSNASMRWTLGVVFQPAKWQLLLDHQAPDIEGSIGLFDRERQWIARSAAAKRAPLPPAPDLLKDVADANSVQGLERATPAGSPPVYLAWRAVGATGWSVAVGVLADPIDRKQRNGITSAVLGGLLSLAIGIACALVVSRGVTSPLARLAQGLWPRRAGGKWSSVAEIERLTRALEIAEAERDADRAARQAKADEFETLFRRTPVGLAIATDRDCRHILGNTALMQLLGLRPDDQLTFAPAAGATRPSFTFLTGSDAAAPAELPLHRAAQLGEDVQGVEYTVARDDGSILQVLAYATPLRAADGSTRGAIGAFIDVTAQRRSDRQRAVALENEQRARQDAEGANRSKDEFLAMFSHELRNPLSAIASAAEVLNRIGGQKPDEIRARDVIRRQIHNLTRMMEDLLDVTRVVNGKLSLSRAPLDLAAAVQRSVAALNVMGRMRDHRLQLDVAPVWINADSMRIEQIASNLLTNAVKYTPAEGSITVKVCGEGEQALLVVGDTGVGIQPTMLDRVFDLFVQGERGSARRQGGLGVGLTLVRRLTEIHGGSVRAASEGADRGSRFEVRFPRIAPPEDG